jgi:DNA invertase Pin-like site-specific DNA recombinase
MRVAIYARVSTDDKGQDPENQLRELRAWCANAGHTIVQEYIDRESGRKGVHTRKQFAALFEDAHRRKFDCVLFWALDRFSREGMVPTIMYLHRLASYGVSFHSYTEAHLATDNEMVRNILLSVMSSLAKVEAQKIGERTRAGMARAKAQGKHIGRPPLDPVLRNKIAKHLAAGLSAYAVGKRLGIDPHTVAKYGRPFAESADASLRGANPSPETASFGAPT